jgi:hypothetical protein
MDRAHLHEGKRQMGRTDILDRSERSELSQAEAAGKRQCIGPRSTRSGLATPHIVKFSWETLFPGAPRADL